MKKFRKVTFIFLVFLLIFVINFNNISYGQEENIEEPQIMTYTTNSSKGWKKMDGNWYFYNDAGEMIKDKWIWAPIDLNKDGVYEANNFKYFNKDGINVQVFYHSDSNIWLSQVGPYTEYLKGWWESESGMEYYFRKSSGTRVNGWQFIDGHWRYFRDSGTLIKSDWAWVPVNSNDMSYCWKFFNSKGRSMDQFYKDNGKTYLSLKGPDTSYKKGSWISETGLEYYFDHVTGERAEGWKKFDNGWMYFRIPSGTLVKDGLAWIDINVNGIEKSNWKYFDGNGINKAYFFRDDSSHWLTQAGPNTEYYKGWWTDPSNGDIYFFRRTSGSGVSSWQFIDGNWKAFSKDGCLMKDTYFKISKKYYYADSKGLIYYNNRLVKSSDIVDGYPIKVSKSEALENMKFEFVNKVTGKKTEYDPETYKFKGDNLLVIDISEWQDPRSMDIDTIAKQVDGVILRIGVTFYGGKGDKWAYDDRFDYYYNEFSKRNVPIGGYWYSCADTVEEAITEANATINKIKGKKLELPIFWDTEDFIHQVNLSRDELTVVGNAYINTLKSNGYCAGVYASSNWLKYEINMDNINTNIVWVAHYGVSSPSYYGPYQMWQYTGTGRIEGFPRDIDINYLYYNYQAYILDNGLNK